MVQQACQDAKNFMFVCASALESLSDMGDPDEATLGSSNDRPLHPNACLGTQPKRLKWEGSYISRVRKLREPSTFSPSTRTLPTYILKIFQSATQEIDTIIIYYDGSLEALWIPWESDASTLIC
jgi:hypothetical protein